MGCEAFATVTTKISVRISAVILAAFFGSLTAFSQKTEIGVQFSGMHLHKVDEAPLGIGIRVNRTITPFLSSDSELTYCPQNPSGNFGETFFLAGGRIGATFDRIA